MARGTEAYFPDKPQWLSAFLAADLVVPSAIVILEFDHLQRRPCGHRVGRRVDRAWFHRRLVSTCESTISWLARRLNRGVGRPLRTKATLAEQMRVTGPDSARWLRAYVVGYLKLLARRRNRPGRREVGRISSSARNHQCLGGDDPCGRYNFGAQVTHETQIRPLSHQKVNHTRTVLEGDSRPNFNA